MTSFIIVRYVWKILGREPFCIPPIHVQPRKGPSWIGLRHKSSYLKIFHEIGIPKCFQELPSCRFWTLWKNDSVLSREFWAGFPKYFSNTYWEAYPVPLRILSKCGKTRTRITPNKDTFYATCFRKTLHIRHGFLRYRVNTVNTAS